MSLRIEANINPELLKWARSTSGFNIGDAAKSIGIHPDVLSDWESGQSLPSISKLRKAARKYKRPLAAFFLPSPPSTPEHPKDFRSLAAEDVELKDFPDLNLAFRRALRKRDEAIDLAEELEIKIQPFEFAGTIDMDPENLGEQARDFLGVSVNDQLKWKDETTALKMWKLAVENRDVLVFQASRIPLEAMRGFSIFEDRFPVIALNGKDFPRPRIFSMFHEFAHLLLRNAGVCNDIYVGPPVNRRRTIEAFCNHFAGAFLVPARHLHGNSIVANESSKKEWSEKELTELSKQYKVSREVILRRLVVLGKCTLNYYRKKRDEYIKAYQRSLKKRGGISTPAQKSVTSNGRKYVELVLNAYQQDLITSTNVSKYLGLRLKHLSDIQSEIRK